MYSSKILRSLVAVSLIAFLLVIAMHTSQPLHAAAGAPTVTVVNTSSNPVPVTGTVTGTVTGSVSVSNTPNVNIANTPTVNVALQGTPYADTCIPGSGLSPCLFNNIPAGTVLVIQSAGFVGDNTNGHFFFAAVRSGINGTLYYSYLNLSAPVDATSPGISFSSIQTGQFIGTAYADSSRTPECDWSSTNTGAVPTAGCTLFGYLIPAH
jgi:hypothetical protein